MAILEFKLTWQAALTVLVLWVAYHILNAVYRVTIHPLASFPGNRFAAVSYKYEFYFDGVRGGQYTAEILRMHEKYGPIVRINPDELHCNDPNFVDQIYASGGEKRDKWSYFLALFGPKSAMSGFGTVPHNLHRIRRAAVNRYFSKASITKLEPLIHGLAQKLCDKLLARCNDHRPAFDVNMAYSCFTTDVITNYCFGQSRGLLDQEGFLPNLHNAICAGLRPNAVIKQWPAIYILVDMIPDAVAKYMSADLAVFLNFQRGLTEEVKKIKRAYDQGKEKELIGRKSIFGELLESSLPEKEKTVARLGTESSALIGAGTETTAWTLSVATFHLLDRPKIYAKLVTELEMVAGDPKNLPNWAVLEQLPYLINATTYSSHSAVILESVRLSYGVSTRLARISPDKPLFYEGSAKYQSYEYVIPKGTPIGMTSVIMHANEDIFPEAQSFIPERWLKEDGSRRTELERYLMSFSKGSRQCLGMNLAYCELYIGLAALVLRVFPHTSLFETTVDDVKYHHDLFIPMPNPESLGVRVLLK